MNTWQRKYHWLSLFLSCALWCTLFGQSLDAKAAVNSSGKIAAFKLLPENGKQTLLKSNPCGTTNPVLTIQTNAAGPVSGSVTLQWQSGGTALSLGSDVSTIFPSQIVGGISIPAITEAPPFDPNTGCSRASGLGPNNPTCSIFFSVPQNYPPKTGLVTISGLNAIPAQFCMVIIPPVATLSITTTSGSPQMTLINTQFGAPLVATVTSNGIPVAGISVAYTPPRGVGIPTALLQTIAITDANGRVSVIARANGVAGSYNVVAALVGVPVPAIFALQNTIAPPAIAPISGTPQAAIINQPFGAPLVANVTIAGAPVSGAIVTFAAPTSATSPGAMLSATTVMTDINGNASVAAVANGVAGFYQATATVSGAPSPAIFDLQNTP